jgi:flagellar biosynthesis protein FlhG
MKPMTSHDAEFWVFVAGKGGVGKSVLMFHVAAQLARQHHRVLLLDTDLGLANLHILANVEPRGRLEGVLAGGTDLHEAVTPLPIGCDLLAADNGQNLCLLPGNGAADALARTLGSLTREYDYILVDTPRGLTEAALQFCRACDLTVLVTTEEPTAVTNSYAWYKLATLTAERFPICLVANRSVEPGLKDHFTSLCHRFLGHAPAWAGSVPPDDEVGVAVLRQQAVFTHAPEAPFWRAVKELTLNLQDIAKQSHNKVPEGQAEGQDQAGSPC